jgi:hypothetical protein
MQAIDGDVFEGVLPHKSELAVAVRGPSDPELQEVTFTGHMTK